MNAADQNTVRVKIYGHEYTVKAVANGQYIQDVAAYVDARMKETELNLTGAISATRIAILAAMSITDELMLETVRLARESGEFVPGRRQPYPQPHLQPASSYPQPHPAPNAKRTKRFRRLLTRIPSRAPAHPPIPGF